MKKRISGIFSALLVLCLVVAGLSYLSDLTERKRSKYKFSDFYNQEENYDVLFMGSSHYLNSVFPMELWKDYGIVSYNMAGHGSRAAANYWILKNALEYTTPKLVVVDCYMLGLEEKMGSIEHLHMAMDHIPFSKTKIEMVQDLVEDKEQQKAFFWKFSIYHNRWNELTTEDFTKEYSPEKGAESRIGVSFTDPIEPYDSSVRLEEETVGMKYLCKTIELCRERGIEVLLTYIPFPGNKGWQLEMNSAGDIAAQYGVDYLDFYTLMSLVNPNTDFYDKNAHMNPSGARKITEFLGAYITIRYGIEDQRQNPLYKNWHEDYQLYKKFKEDNICKEEEITNYLMLLKDKNLSYGIYLRWGLDLSQYPEIIALLSNIGVDSVSCIEERMCLMFVDNINGVQSRITTSESMKTYFGEFSLFYNEEGHLHLFSKDDNKLQVTWSDIAVVVFDNETLELIDQAKFKFADEKVSLSRDRN